MLRPAPAVGEKDAPAVVIHLGIADAAERIVEDRRDIARPRIQPAEAAPVPVELAAVAVGRAAVVKGEVDCSAKT